MILNMVFVKKGLLSMLLILELNLTWIESCTHVDVQ